MAYGRHATLSILSGHQASWGEVMKTFFFAIGVAVISGMVCSVAADLPAEALQPNALRAAQQRGATELGCPAAKANVMSKKTIEETTTGWYEWPHRAEYTIGVSGCGKRVTYSVACDDRKKAEKTCVASPGVTAASPPPAQLADKLQPSALRAAQQRGATELGCPAATANVVSKETIQEAQGTGWYESPHRAAYTVAVAGCGKHTTYSVACDDRTSCVAGTVSTASPSPPPSQLADTMQPDALRAAQGRASSVLGCPSVTAKVLTKETINEAQITGWYEAPHRAEYTIGVSGCGKRVTYSVSCDNQRGGAECIVGGAAPSAAR